LFPIRERLRFRDNLGLGLREVRQRPAFAALARGPWLVFIAIACHWQANAEAWPSQETIAAFTGYSSRAVRDYVDVLERAGVVRLRRERRPDKALGLRWRTLFDSKFGAGLRGVTGAYFSEVDERLSAILFGSDFATGTAQDRLPEVSTRTGEAQVCSLRGSDADYPPRPSVPLRGSPSGALPRACRRLRREGGTGGPDSGLQEAV
jgi:hypothetical protein